MDKPPFTQGYVAGERVEYLGVSAGNVNQQPLGILTFRPQTSLQPINLMISRTQLERLKEDIAFLLERSPSLKDGPSPEVSLQELEGNRPRLG